MDMHVEEGAHAVDAPAEQAISPGSGPREPEPQERAAPRRWAPDTSDDGIREPPPGANAGFSEETIRTFTQLGLHWWH
jgi:hypothetical protein